MNIELTTKEVTANTIRIKSKYTREMLTDLKMFGTGLIEEIERQILTENREKIINDLLDGEKNN